jgi:hypothetical protein
MLKFNLNTSKKKGALKNILITLTLIVFTLSFAPYSNKPFQELSSFNQYQPCKKQFNISNEMLKNYNLGDILLVEFQVSFIIFGFEQDYYLENGLDCRFEKRYSFDETIKNGKYLTFFTRRLFSLSSYALFVLIIWFLIKQFKIITEDRGLIDKNESDSEELELPVLYSKKAILGFTIFFTPLFGAVLLMSNFKVLNKNKPRTQVLVFAIGYTLISKIILNYLPVNIFNNIVFNFLGYFILSKIFWDKNLNKNFQYTKKQINKPLIISFLILVFISGIQFLLHELA